MEAATRKAALRRRSVLDYNSHPLHLAQEARTMTGEFARLVVGAWMTAALSVSGFFSTPPAAHAGGGSSATCSVNRLR